MPEGWHSKESLFPFSHCGVVETHEELHSWHLEERDIRVALPAKHQYASAVQLPIFADRACDLAQNDCDLPHKCFLCFPSPSQNLMRSETQAYRKYWILHSLSSFT